MRQPLLNIADDAPAIEAPAESSITDQAFRSGDRKTLFVGNKPLGQYLAESGQSVFLRIAEQLDRLDVRPLLSSYSPIGRHAIHPRIILSLIVLGILLDKSSLRGLEQLAICDVRGWWFCRGEQPDHSTIGKFVTTHAAWIDGEGFQEALKQAVRRLGLQSGTAAMDGTVIESAASRLNMLKKDAAREAAQAAAQAAAESPEDPRAQRAAECAEKVAEAAASRTEARSEHGRPADHLRVPATDPDAVNQPLKNGVVAPAYKPSILVDENQLIAAQRVDASSETAAVKPLLEQYEQARGSLPKTLLADAGYFAIGVIALALANGIDLLVPSGRASNADNVERKSKLFPKHLFVFQPGDEVYRCPTNQTLRPLRSSRDRDGRMYTKYGGAPCANCPERQRCTTGKNGRTINRYEGDELKDAEREVMRQPAALQKYRERGAMVEPVFGRMRQMGLRRFRRRGLVRVRAEFALYCIAYNLKRADAIHEARVAAFFVVRVWGGPVALVVCVATIAR
jgi:transposase